MAEGPDAGGKGLLPEESIVIFKWSVDLDGLRFPTPIGCAEADLMLLDYGDSFMHLSDRSHIEAGLFSAVFYSDGEASLTLILAVAARSRRSCCETTATRHSAPPGVSAPEP